MARLRATPPELRCPACGARPAAGERFCADCGLPLVRADWVPDGEARPPSERRRRARMVKPQLSEGELVKVAWARNQPEAEFMQQLLLQVGVPSLLRRSAGYDVPDMLAAGPRDVLVPAAGADTARETLLAAALIEPDPARPRPPIVVPARLLAGLLVAVVLGALVIWALGH